MSYIKYIQNEDHYKEVLSKAAKVKESLWIGTADIKVLYVGDGPFLTAAVVCVYDLVNHHHALADAEACAYIAMKLL